MVTQSRRRNSGIGRAATTGVLVCGLILGSAGPGAAYGFKDGYKWRSSCTIQPSDPWLHVTASGTVDIVAPGKSTVTQRSGTGSWDVAGTYNGGYWWVEASISVSSTGTYDFCRNP